MVVVVPRSGKMSLVVVVLLPDAFLLSHQRLVFGVMVNWDRLFAAHFVDYIFSFILWGWKMLSNAMVMGCRLE